MMNRVGLARVARQVSSRRVSLACGARGRSLLRRSYSASSGGQRSGNGGNVLPSLLGAAAALSAIYFVYPFEKKPKQEAKSEPEAVQEAQDEPATEPETAAQEPETAAQEPADEAEQQPDEAETEEPANQAEKPDEGSSEQSETISEGPADSEPTKENTVSSTGSEESGKDLKSDEEIQKVEEAQLEPTNQEAEQEGAYNPDTGEINWDCPCLGGMAHGPCGEEFKLAFSCFVFSEAEPKGIDCVEKFQGMQECFRKYPDYYAEQIKDEEEAVAVRDDKIAAATTGEEAKQGTETEAGSGNPDGKQGETVTEQPQDNKSSGAPAEQDMKAVSDE